MAKIFELPEPTTDVRATLENCLAQADGLEGVMILGLTKDSQPWLRTSSMNMFRKAFLVAFMNAFMARWFNMEDE